MKDINIENKENQYKKYISIKSKLVWGKEDAVENPLFSVVVPTCGRHTTIRDTLKSIVNQISPPVFEVVIVDNDPESKTIDIIKEFDDLRFRYYVNEKNIGLCGNWNRCTELSRGKYISMIHDDDILSPFFLNIMSSFVRNKNVYGVVGVGCEVFSDCIPTFTEKECKTFHKISEMDFFFGNYIQIAGMTYNKALAMNLGGFQENDYPNEDTIFIEKAILYSEVFKLDCVLTGYRQALNLSMKEGILEKVVIYDYATKLSMAKRNKKIKCIMNLFNTEMFFEYFHNAEKRWGKKMNYDELINETDLKRQYPNFFRRIILKIIRKTHSIHYKAGTKIINLVVE